MLALVVVLIFVVMGQDPVLALFTWLTNLATLSVITLMALASFSVLAFFGRQPELEPAAGKRFLAPVVAGIVLAIIAVMVVIHFGDLTGASPALSIALPILVPVAALIGIIVAAGLKRREAARFAAMGAHQGGR